MVRDTSNQASTLTNTCGDSLRTERHLPQESSSVEALGSVGHADTVKVAFEGQSNRAPILCVALLAVVDALAALASVGASVLSGYVAI